MRRTMTRRHFQTGSLAMAGALAAGGSLTSRSARAEPPALPPEVDPIRTTAVTPGGLKIHAIQTGWVAVKEAHRTLSGWSAVRLPAILFDDQWTEWLPVHAWLIEHEDGLICVDAGETARTKDPAYFECDSGTAYFYQRNLRFVVRPEDEIGAQIKALGFSPRDVRTLILTHLHSDHMGGLPDFEDADILCPQADYPDSQGTLPCRYPDWFAPRFPVFKSTDLSGLGQAYDVTRAGDVRIVPTPGHSDGHHSVLIESGGVTYLIAGDATFDESQLLSQQVAGICSDIGDARDTIASLRQFLTARPSVYLPTHDAASPHRIVDSQVTRIA